MKLISNVTITPLHEGPLQLQSVFTQFASRAKLQISPMGFAQCFTCELTITNYEVGIKWGWEWGWEWGYPLSFAIIMPLLRSSPPGFALRATALLGTVR